MLRASKCHLRVSLYVVISVEPGLSTPSCLCLCAAGSISSGQCSSSPVTGTAACQDEITHAGAPHPRVDGKRYLFTHAANSSSKSEQHWQHMATWQRCSSSPHLHIFGLAGLRLHIICRVPVLHVAVVSMREHVCSLACKLFPVIRIEWLVPLRQQRLPDILQSEQKENISAWVSPLRKLRTVAPMETSTAERETGTRLHPSVHVQESRRTE